MSEISLYIFQLNSTCEALNWIMNAMSKNKMGEGTPPVMKVESDVNERQKVANAEEKQFQELCKTKGGIVHSKCRTSPYVQASKINRFPVPNAKLYWEVKFDDL